MTPRQPPDKTEDDKQSELLRAIHRSINDLTPVKEQPAPRTEQDAPRLVQPEDVEVELDRIEAYLRGPTAFTA
jgi:hypothetical protein